MYSHTPPPRDAGFVMRTRDVRSDHPRHHLTVHGKSNDGISKKKREIMYLLNLSGIYYAGFICLLVIDVRPSINEKSIL